MRAAQQDASPDLQPVGVECHLVRQRDRGSICLDVAPYSSPGKSDLPGHVRAADRETAARLEPFGLQAGKGRAVQEKIVDDRGAQHRSSVEETILEADVARDAATFKVQFSDHASAADSQPLLVQAGAFVATKNEEANELGANDSRRIIPLRAQAIAQPFEISRPQ